jgi:nucleoside-diphosphate-sugar epimerase
MKICVTGSRGYIGTLVTDALRKNLYEVDEIDLKIDKNYSMSKSDSKVLVHLGAHTSVPESEKFPDMYYNNNITDYDLFLRLNSFDRIIYASSNSIYDGNTLINPSSVYSISKLTGEYITRKHCQNYTILRFSNPIGIDKILHKDIVKDIIKGYQSLAWTLAKCVVNEKVFTLHDLPGMARDFYPVEWIVKAVIDLVKSPAPGKIYHIGSGLDKDVASLARKVCEVFKIKLKTVPPPMGTSRGYVSDNLDFSYISYLIGPNWDQFNQTSMFISSMNDYCSLLKKELKCV